MKLEARDLTKNFPRGKRRGQIFTAVRPLDFSLASGSLAVIAGRSGSGKSTLLNMLAGMLTPTSGSVHVAGAELYSLSEAARSRLRNEKIGLVPQGHAALRSLTVLENVLLPSILYSHEPPPQQRALELLELVDIASLQDAKPSELSGGELRRLAIARALLLHPQVVLADEPTAGLDADNTIKVLELLRGAADAGAAVLVVTHEDEATQFADRTFSMDAGTLTAQTPPANAGQSA
ncbi:ABC transporter ATP-binding protein [Actinomyces sp. MRS3W]|uniref:ABC transporter ATP-binding protein n=1 Tax=Actinomyces sp. MRS3W TaxID=2800796 RepID=UPI0028FD4123|nr:ABC transporter ATP-binding protein [Actinomyces sp. MRS3W]MDU0349797.1 ABC transporter ATP-binding protein [Actinomyces sp. MRS3W]